MQFSFNSRPVLFSAFLIAFLAFGQFGCKPMCPIVNCNVRMVHLHGKAEYRGSKWYKKQNPHIGQKLPKSTQDGVAPHNDHSRMRK
jgi:hypothetical protein